MDLLTVPKSLLQFGGTNNRQASLINCFRSSGDVLEKNTCKKRMEGTFAVRISGFQKKHNDASLMMFFSSSYSESLQNVLQGCRKYSKTPQMDTVPQSSPRFQTLRSSILTQQKYDVRVKSDTFYTSHLCFDIHTSQKFLDDNEDKRLPTTR